MYPERSEETRVILGSINMGYVSDTARNQTRNLFHRKRAPVLLGHNDGQMENKKLNIIPMLIINNH